MTSKQERDNNIALQMEALTNMEGWGRLKESLDKKLKVYEEELCTKVDIPFNPDMAIALIQDQNIKRARVDVIKRFLNEPWKYIKKKSIVQKDLDELIQKQL